jgi:hypothetical protein
VSSLWLGSTRLERLVLDTGGDMSSGPTRSTLTLGIGDREVDTPQSCGRATALFASLTLSLSFCVMNRVMLSITR